MDGRERVRSYHERTKHRVERYAPGPETLDWTAPPDPFRAFAGAPRFKLPLCADRLDTTLGEVSERGVAARAVPLSVESIGALLELSFAITAWKTTGIDTWAVRALPSSGNLHPTEVYVCCRQVSNLSDGLYHYDAREHALELRRADPASPGGPTLWLGLSSIHWREAWKYGERSFRYCQLDMGHALAALGYAAALLGWQARRISWLSSAQAARWLGLDRAEDFRAVESEEPGPFVEIRHQPASPAELASPRLDAQWQGQASRIDPYPMYRWPILDEVALATRKPASLPQVCELAPSELARPAPSPWIDRTPRGADVIRARRSAQRFDGRFVLPQAALAPLLRGFGAALRGPCAEMFTPAAVHAVAFVQRVKDVAPGVYALAQDERAEEALRSALDPRFLWRSTELGAGLCALQLSEGANSQVTRRMCCGQAIAADANLVIALLAEFDKGLDQGPWRYRELHWEAGVLGHVLYLEATALGLAGTGIGCFFDDEVHQLLGIEGTRLQTLYCFSVGSPVFDVRVQSAPPYPSRLNTQPREVPS